MSPSRKDPHREDRDDAARLIERRLAELLQTPSTDRPDLPVWAEALVTELHTKGWRCIGAIKNPWAPDTSRPPASRDQVAGYSRVARRRIEDARRPTPPKEIE